MICVPPDYEYDTFCGKTVSDSDVCADFKKLFNHCFKGTFSDGEFSQKMRKNTTDWIERTNGCMRYECNDKIGKVSWSMCNSTDEETRMCIDGQCHVEDKEAMVEDGKTWSVEIDMSDADVKPEDLDLVEVKTNISELTGVDSEDIVLAVEVDDSGKLVRVVVYVKDEETATIVADKVKDVANEGENCTYGTLCLMSNIQVNQLQHTSSGPRTMVSMFSVMIVLTAAIIQVSL